ncbi:hypothetical protein BDZ97DRAFT_1985830 [Flammula alnicola]|nr:hypothetical protein BDZ97DRAFT_1985830 [Flammula alnicola]
MTSLYMEINLLPSDCPSISKTWLHCVILWAAVIGRTHAMALCAVLPTECHSRYYFWPILRDKVLLMSRIHRATPRLGSLIYGYKKAAQLERTSAGLPTPKPQTTTALVARSSTHKHNS